MALVSSHIPAAAPMKPGCIPVPMFRNLSIVTFPPLPELALVSFCFVSTNSTEYEHGAEPAKLLATFYLLF